MRWLTARHTSTPKINLQHSNDNVEIENIANNSSNFFQISTANNSEETREISPISINRSETTQIREGKDSQNYLIRDSYYSLYDRHWSPNFPFHNSVGLVDRFEVTYDRQEYTSFDEDQTLVETQLSLGESEEDDFVRPLQLQYDEDQDIFMEEAENNERQLIDRNQGPNIHPQEGDAVEQVNEVHRRIEEVVIDPDLELDPGLDQPQADNAELQVIVNGPRAEQAEVQENVVGEEAVEGQEPIMAARVVFAPDKSYLMPHKYNPVETYWENEGDFWRAFKIYSIYHGDTFPENEDKVRSFTATLEGAALQWFLAILQHDQARCAADGIDPIPNNINDLEILFLAKWKKDQNRNSWRNALKKLRYKTGDDVKKLAIKFNAMAHKLDMHADDRLDGFLRIFDQQIVAFALGRDVHNVDDVVRAVLSYQDYMETPIQQLDMAMKNVSFEDRDKYRETECPICSGKHKADTCHKLEAIIADKIRNDEKAKKVLESDSNPRDNRNRREYRDTRNNRDYRDTSRDRYRTADRRSTSRDSRDNRSDGRYRSQSRDRTQNEWRGRNRSYSNDRDSYNNRNRSYSNDRDSYNNRNRSRDRNNNYKPYSSGRSNNSYQQNNGQRYENQGGYVDNNPSRQNEGQVSGQNNYSYRPQQELTWTENNDQRPYDTQENVYQPQFRGQTYKYGNRGQQQRFRGRGRNGYFRKRGNNNNNYNQRQRQSNNNQRTTQNVPAIQYGTNGTGSGSQNSNL